MQTRNFDIKYQDIQLLEIELARTYRSEDTVIAFYRMVCKIQTTQVADLKFYETLSLINIYHW